MLIPTLQFGIISKLVRFGYLLQNFKKAIIQNCKATTVEQQGGRPCRVEIRWCGATDVGLRDVRDNVNLWGLQCETDRHAELTAMEQHKEKASLR